MNTQSKEVEYYQTRERTAGRERRSGVSVGVAKTWRRLNRRRCRKRRSDGRV